MVWFIKQDTFQNESIVERAMIYSKRQNMYKEW